MVSRDNFFSKMGPSSLATKSRKSRGGKDSDRLKARSDVPPPLPSPRTLKSLQLPIIKARMTRRMSDTPETPKCLLKRFSSNSLRNLHCGNRSTQSLDVSQSPTMPSSRTTYPEPVANWPCFAPPFAELSASYVTPEDMWVDRKLYQSPKKASTITPEFDDLDDTLDELERCYSDEPVSPILSLSGTEWSGHTSQHSGEGMTALRPQPVKGTYLPVDEYSDMEFRECDLQISGAFTFFDSDDDNEPEGHEAPATPMPSEEDEFSDSDTSTLRSEYSGPVRSSRCSSSMSGKASNDKAARILGLDRNSISSLGSFAASTLVGDPDVPSDALFETPNEVSPADAITGNSLHTNGWRNSVMHTDTKQFTAGSSATVDAAWLWKALHGSKKVDTTLLNTVVVDISRDPERIIRLRRRYRELYVDDLLSAIRSKTQGQYRTALCCLIQGPYETSTRWFNHTDSNFILDDKLVAEALFGKEPDEIKLLIVQFQQEHGHSLKSALETLYINTPFRSTFGSDAEATTECFGLACIRTLAADRDVERAEGLDSMTLEQRRARETRLSHHVEMLYRMSEKHKRKMLNPRLLLELVMTKSPLYLAELSRQFSEHHGVQLTDLVSSKNRSKSGGEVYPASLAYGIIYALNGATSRPQRDAQLIEDSLAKSRSMHSSPERFLARCIRIYHDSDSSHLEYVKEVYHQRYGRRLVDRVAGSAKGPCRELLVRIMDGPRDQSL